MKRIALFVVFFGLLLYTSCIKQNLFHHFPDGIVIKGGTPEQYIVRKGKYHILHVYHASGLIGLPHGIQEKTAFWELPTHLLAKKTKRTNVNVRCFSWKLNPPVRTFAKQCKGSVKIHRKTSRFVTATVSLKARYPKGNLWQYSRTLTFRTKQLRDPVLSPN